MQEHYVLTPAESKRLIAKAIVEATEVSEALENGIVIVCTGSTNAYVHEELTGKTIEKWKFLTGRHTPRAGIVGDAGKKPCSEIPNLVFRNGRPDPKADWLDVLDDMGPGDVILKGANAINYEIGRAHV